MGWAAEKLAKGEHASPPKGYPKDPNLYACPKYFLYPLDNEEHVKAAITLYSKHDWKPDEEPEEAARRIIRFAKKYDIKVGHDTAVWKATNK
jgi:hypothetical protein